MSQQLELTDDYLGLSHLSASICAELAAGLTDSAGIMSKYELTQIQWNRLKVNPAFRGMLKEAIGKFSGDMNAGKRIVLKSEILLEDSLPILDSIIHDNDGAAGNKLDSIKQLTVLAQKGGKQESQVLGGSGFNVEIHINTGGGKDAIEPLIIEQPAQD